MKINICNNDFHLLCAWYACYFNLALHCYLAFTQSCFLFSPVSYYLIRLWKLTKSKSVCSPHGQQGQLHWSWGSYMRHASTVTHVAAIVLTIGREISVPSMVWFLLPDTYRSQPAKPPMLSLGDGWLTAIKGKWWGESKLQMAFSCHIMRFSSIKSKKNKWSICCWDAAHLWLCLIRVNYEELSLC